MWDKRTAHILLVLFILSVLSISLCSGAVSATAQPSLALGSVTHTFKPLNGSDVYQSEVALDVVSVSGTTDPGATVSAQQSIFNKTNATVVSVGANGAFVLTVGFTAGPDYAKGIESGAIRLTVRATSGGATKEVDMNLKPTAGLQPSAQSATVSAATAGSAGYPHTLVVYNNPTLFSYGQYRNDNGQDVQTNKDDVAAQLAKFSAVSLHYTDDASNIALIKQKNPNTKVFAYINPIFCYIQSSEYQNVVQHHPEWFLYPSVADRQNKTNPIVYDSEQVMDLTTGWQAEVVSLSKAALAKGFDGLYIDCVCDDPSLCYGYGANTAPVGNWHDALDAYLGQVQEAGKQNFYNGQSPVVVPTNLDFLNRTYGWMDEGFISYKGWKLSAIDMPQYASAHNKFSMFYAVNSSAIVRHFYFTSALLSDGYFFYAPASTQWFAEYGTFCGDPVGQAYEMPGFPGVWARDYAAAKVIVNPTSASVTVSMPGYTDSNGNPTSQVTINPNDGVILKLGTGRVNVVARGGDGALYYKGFSAGWGDWQRLGGQLAPGTGPAVSSWAAGRLDVFVVGTDGAPYHKWFDNGWHDWERFDGYLTASPAAAP